MAAAEKDGRGESEEQMELWPGFHFIMRTRRGDLNEKYGGTVAFNMGCSFFFQLYYLDSADSVSSCHCLICPCSLRVH